MKAETLLLHQLRNIFLLSDEEEKVIAQGNLLRDAEDKAMRSLAGFHNKYYDMRLNPLNGVMYCNYLYWVSFLLHGFGTVDIAAKVYDLNKMLHSVELFYEIKLPEIWSCEHPIGSVMGRAEYGNYFFFYQGCTVGGSRHQGDLFYPTIGEHVTMFSGAKVIGNSKIGNNVILAANAYVINSNVPDNSIVFGQGPDIVIKSK